ncbi:MAG TPA: LysM peptidoglycan-binding domain-containing protein [Actinomycetota bacterium]|nr:LysM peptidoglycan-binding domain-containing protein [Actinomycetota bacterium]
MEANTCSSESFLARPQTRLARPQTRLARPQTRTRPQARSRIRWDRVALVIALLTGMAGAVGRAAADAPGDRAERYVVRPGDTLWDIARARVGLEGDPRPLIADIREANQLGTAVLPAGRVLVLPGV